MKGLSLSPLVKWALDILLENVWSVEVDILLANVYCIEFVFFLSALSPCTSGLKPLHDPSDCTSTVQLSNY